MSDPALSQKATLGLAAGMAALAAALGWIAIDSAAAFARARAARRVVDISTGAGAALVAAVILALFAALLLSRSPARQRALFRAAIWLTPLLVLMPLALWLASEHWLPGEGYRRCAPLAGQRFMSAVWAPQGMRCPD